MAPRWPAFALAILAMPAATGGPLLVAVGPDLPHGTEAVAVGSDAPWDLAGWALDDGEGRVPLPALTLQARERVWLTNNATAWARLQGEAPAQEWSAVGNFRLSDSGEGLHLVDPQGRRADAFAWGDGSAEGIDGPIRRTSEALLYQRDAGWPDTDRAADWVTPRLHRLGESRLEPVRATVPALTLYSSPDSTHDVLARLIAGARSRLHLHVYELQSLDLAQRMADAKRAHPGLDLQVLVDSQPVGMTAPKRHLQTQALVALQDAGGTVVLSGHSRYGYHHLKVLVADAAVAVQSENWVESGAPRHPSLGNRGWGVVAHDPGLADWFSAWMAEDRAAWDALPFDAQAFDPAFEPVAAASPRTGAYGPTVPARTLEGTFTVTPLVAPDHTHDPRRDPIVALLDGARHTVRVQQLDLRVNATNGLGWSSPDPLLDALRRASGRGVQVRVQAAAPFSAEDEGNAAALRWLAGHGVEGQVMARPGILTLHNKGILVDDRVAVVGSMNGNHHSRSANREVALVVEGPGVATWFAALFDADWEGPGAPPDAAVVAKDVRGIPWAPLPSLLALAGVGAALRVRRG